MNRLSELIHFGYAPGYDQALQDWVEENGIRCCPLTAAWCAAMDRYPMDLRHRAIWGDKDEFEILVPDLEDKVIVVPFDLENLDLSGYVPDAHWTVLLYEQFNESPQVNDLVALAHFVMFLNDDYCLPWEHIADILESVGN